MMGKELIIWNTNSKQASRRHTAVLWILWSFPNSLESPQTERCIWQWAPPWCRPPPSTRRPSATSSRESSTPPEREREVIQLSFMNKLSEFHYMWAGKSVPGTGTGRAETAACRRSCRLRAFLRSWPWWTCLRTRRSSTWRTDSSPSHPTPSESTHFALCSLKETKRDAQTSPSVVRYEEGLCRKALFDGSLLKIKVLYWHGWFL